MVYNLLYYQIIAQVSCGLTTAERARVASESTWGGIKNLSDGLNLINECLGQTDLYMEDDSTSGKPEVNILALEQQVNLSKIIFLANEKNRFLNIKISYLFYFNVFL